MHQPLPGPAALFPGYPHLYWNKFGILKTMPELLHHRTRNSDFDVGAVTWWIRDPPARAHGRPAQMRPIVLQYIAKRPQ